MICSGLIRNCRLNQYSTTLLSVHRQSERGRQRSAIWAISRTAGRRPRKEMLTLRIAWNPSLWRLRSYVSLELKVRLRVRENKTAITACLYSSTILLSERRLLQIPLSTFRPRDLTFSHGNRTKGSGLQTSLVLVALLLLKLGECAHRRIHAGCTAKTSNRWLKQRATIPAGIVGLALLGTRSRCVDGWLLSSALG
jgi:hypothetical protein